jgi:hypothetical protein
MVDLDRNQFGLRLSDSRLSDWRSVLGWGENQPSDTPIVLPQVEGVFMVWEKTTDSSGKISLRKKYFQLAN